MAVIDPSVPAPRAGALSSQTPFDASNHRADRYAHAEALFHAGRFAEARAVFEACRASIATAHPNYAYYMACCHAREGDRAAALSALRLALEDGFSDLRHAANDADLAAIRGTPEFEAMLAGDPRTGRYCHGETPTLADLLLVPQIFNAQRFDCRLDHVPTVMRIHAQCMTLPAFAGAVPAVQPDAE